MIRVVALFMVLAGASASAAPKSVFLTDVNKALALAKAKKKPLLVDFFGIWCPPCNELDETVFETKGFLEKAKGFVLLKVDADAKASWKIKDRYKVGGYPTVVFANAHGKEIYRIVGYRTPREFLRVMDLVLAAKDKDLEKACASKADDDLWRCAITCAERKEPCAEEAFKRLETKLQPGSPRYVVARNYFVENAPNSDLKRDGYERLMNEIPASPLALLWATEYLEGFEGSPLKPKKELVEKVVANAGAMAADPGLEELGLSVTDVAQIQADLLGKLGKEAESKASWKRAATLLEKAAVDLKSAGAARGFTLERIACLEQAGLVDEALKLSDEYRAKFPGEFTFHYWSASILKRSKRYAEALPVAQQAYESSYGDNRIRVATLLVELYATIPDRAAAQKVRDEIFRDIQPDTKLEVRTHRYLKRLDEAWAKIAAIKSE